MSLWSSAMASSWMTGPPWSGSTNWSRAAIVCSGNWASAAGGVSAAAIKDEVEGAQGERGEEARACGVVAVQRPDPAAGLFSDRGHRDLLAVAPDHDCRGVED